VVEELKKVEMKSLQDKEWLIEGVVMREGHIYVPKGKLREEVVYLYHDMLVEEYGER